MRGLEGVSVGDKMIVSGGSSLSSPEVVAVSRTTKTQVIADSGRKHSGDGSPIIYRFNKSTGRMHGGSTWSQRYGRAASKEDIEKLAHAQWREAAIYRAECFKFSKLNDEELKRVDNLFKEFNH